MRFNISVCDLTDAGTWLIILIYAVFWLYSSYSLVALLWHIYQQDRAIEEESFEIDN